jgi:hypothetical protein
MSSSSTTPAGCWLADDSPRGRGGNTRLHPCLGTILAARVLGEFGDDQNRYVDAKARKSYAGTAPITRASGMKRIVLARYARNRRLGDALQQWASARSADRPEPGRTTSSCARNIGHQAAPVVRESYIAMPPTRGSPSYSAAGCPVDQVLIRKRVISPRLTHALLHVFLVLL